jgi:hypothetical protein
MLLDHRIDVHYGNAQDLLDFVVTVGLHFPGKVREKSAEPAIAHDVEGLFSMAFDSNTHIQDGIPWPSLPYCFRQEWIGLNTNTRAPLTVE